MYFDCNERSNSAVHCDVIIKRTCEANPASEKSSFIFTVCVKSVPLYHSRLAM